jgi:hypothetical protein
MKTTIFFVLLALACVSANYFCLYEGTTCTGTKLAGKEIISGSCSQYLFDYGDVSNDEYWLTTDNTTIGSPLRRYALPGSGAQCATQLGTGVCVDVSAAGVTSQSIKICDSSAVSIGISAFVVLLLIAALL